MNIYDTRPIKCYKYGRWIGEVAYDEEIICPKCSDCADPFPKGNDLLLMPIKSYGKKSLKENV